MVIYYPFPLLACIQFRQRSKPKGCISRAEIIARRVFLQITRQTIQFNPASDYWLDVTEFTGLIAASKGHRHRRLEACRPCMERLQRAAELYRGDLLAGFSLDSVLFEEWLVVQRERFHRQVMDLLYQLAAYYEGRGAYEPCASS